MKLKIIIVLFLLMFTVSLADAQGPTINVEKAQQQPIPAQPGQTVDVWISVQNTGSADARNLEIEFVDSNIFKLISERERLTEISVLGTQKDYMIKYTIHVDSDAPEGVSNVEIRHRTSNERGESSRLIPIEVKTTEAIATIGDVVLEPSEVTPGEEAKLTLIIRNIGGSNLRDFTLGLNLDKEVGPQDMIINDPPFTPVSSGTEKAINRIRPGQTTYFTFDLQAYPNAETGVYKIPVYMSYFDDNGNKHEKDDIITLKVNAEHQLSLMVDNSELTKQNSLGDVTFIIVNHGLSDLKLVNLELNENENFTIRSASNQAYLGSLESDDFDTIRFRINALAEEEITFPVTLTFRDSMNNEFTEEFLVVHRLNEGQSGNNAFLIIIVLLILVIGYWYYRKNKQRSLEQEN